MATTVERGEISRDGHWSSRSISILAALAVDAGLIWLLYFRAKFNPPIGEAELFWVRVLLAFGIYAVVQQWTLRTRQDAAMIFPPRWTSSLRPVQLLSHW